MFWGLTWSEWKPLVMVYLVGIIVSHLLAYTIAVLSERSHAKKENREPIKGKFITLASIVADILWPVLWATAFCYILKSGITGNADF